MGGIKLEYPVALAADVDAARIFRGSCWVGLAVGSIDLLLAVMTLLIELGLLGLNYISDDHDDRVQFQAMYLPVVLTMLGASISGLLRARTTRLTVAAYVLVALLYVGWMSALFLHSVVPLMPSLDRENAVPVARHIINGLWRFGGTLILPSIMLIARRPLRTAH